MYSAKETRYRKSMQNKLTLLIMLWVLDKIVMLIMLLCLR